MASCTCPKSLYFYPPIKALRLTLNGMFTGITDATDVSQWNVFFNLPTNGNPFTSVQVIGNEIRLFGGSDIHLQDSVFDHGPILLKINDASGCITSTGYHVFVQNENLTYVSLPEMTTAGEALFDQCTSLKTINLPKCTNLGGSVGNDDVFDNISGNNISLTIPQLLMTCNAGSPDGDIAYLQANNNVYIVNTDYTSPLVIKFTDIQSADDLVHGVSDISNWNAFFSLPDNGNPFTSVDITGNEVYLFGGSNIIFKNNLFYGNSNLTEIIDKANCIISIGENCFFECQQLSVINIDSVVSVGNNCFYYCNSLTSLNFPNVISIGQACFNSCISLVSVDFPLLNTTEQGIFSSCYNLESVNIPNATQMKYSTFNGCQSLAYINMSSCVNLGHNVSDNEVFNQVVGCTISIIIPSYLMTCNLGNPDGDIQYLQDNNTVTITTV